MKGDDEPDYAAGSYWYDPKKNMTFFRSALTGQVLEFDGPPKFRKPPALVPTFVKPPEVRHDA